MADKKQQYLSKENLDQYSQMISQVIREKLEEKADKTEVATINDDATSLTSVWSSEKVFNELFGIINDDEKSDSSTYSSAHISDLIGDVETSISGKQDKLTDPTDSYETVKGVSEKLDDYYTKTDTDETFATTEAMGVLSGRVTKVELGVVPVGSIILSAAGKMEGYLECVDITDPAAPKPIFVSKDEYRELFNVIGVTYGAGDDGTTFALPCIPPVAVQDIKGNTLYLQYIIKY